MRILLVKTSSLGDVIHNLPVVSDLRRAFPKRRSTGVSRKAFADVPSSASGVSVRSFRWPSGAGASTLAASPPGAKCAISGAASRPRYDVVLDTQGLLKSA
jgi:heptosyltransferase-1